LRDTKDTSICVKKQNKTKTIQNKKTTKQSRRYNWAAAIQSLKAGQELLAKDNS